MKATNATGSGQGDRRETLVLSVTLALVFIVIGSVIGTTAGPETDGWYAGLAKSPLSPPGWVFGVVWPVLYGLIGVSTALIWASRERAAARAALVVMAIQLILNYAWSFIFFRFHMIDLAFWWIVLVGFWVALLIVTTWHFRRLAAVLLLPYFAWLCFAAYLSGAIMARN